ncbi:MAG: hypothetical protein LBQ24_00450 [Candidatus Peribacteria bacterium]|nr:hypothetical protein [Candidatus Peribacteria bacterium]
MEVCEILAISSYLILFQLFTAIYFIISFASLIFSNFKYSNKSFFTNKSKISQRIFCFSKIFFSNITAG